jgi:hypothetical protein
LEYENTGKLHKLFKPHSSAITFGEKICPANIANIEQKVELTKQQHPARQNIPKITILDKLAAAEKVVNTENFRSYYTDASKQGDSSIGSAVVGWSQDCWLTIGMATMRPWESVFRGELKAIEMALDHIEANARDADTSFVIFSDSLSGLQAIRNIYSQEVY